MMSYEWRNPQYNQRGTIDCEILLPDREIWLLTTVKPDDVEPTIRDLYASIVAEGDIAPASSVVITLDQVDAERARRVADTFSFGGVLYQCDKASQQNMIAKGAQAKFAVLNGAVAGDLRWSNPDQDFGWIATDNSITPMDAQTTAAFADAADLWVTAHVIAARLLKNMTPIPLDYANDKYWP